ncbi:MAG: YlbF family regulator [Romboutsia sp.]
MDINRKAKEFASYIKSTEEFKNMNRCKLELEKNRSLKRQLDSFINKKNSIYSNYKIEDATRKMATLNQEYDSFFSMSVVSNYMLSTRNFNTMMEKLYKSIEQELLK